MTLIPAFIHHRIAHRPNLVKIVDNIGWLFFDKILRMGVGLLVGVWVARYLGPEQFGLLSFATAFVGLFGAIATMGLQGIVVRDIVRNPGSEEETLGTAAALQFLGGLIAYGLILATIFWLRADDTLAKAIVAILGSMMLFKAPEIAVYWFESQVLSKYTVWVQNGVFLIFAAIKVGLILQNAPLVAFAWAMMAEALIVAIILLVVLGCRGPKLRSLCVRLSRVRPLLKDSWPLLLSGTFVLANMNIGKVFLIKYSGETETGIYSAAYNLTGFFFFIPLFVGASISPRLTELFKINNDTYRRWIVKVYFLLALTTLMLCFVVWASSDLIIKILYGDNYSESGNVLAILIWSIVFISIVSLRGRLLVIEERETHVALMAFWGLCFNVILLYLLVPAYGAIGAAYAFILSWLLNAAIYPLYRLAKSY